jgi:DNA-binding transcriptional ArsR family regulator
MSEDRLSRVFAALADPTRRDIVARLSVGDATVGQLAAPYDVSIQAVSKHLKVLEDAGLVSRSHDAQRRPRHLEADVFDLMTAWIERYRGRPRNDTADSTPYSPPWTTNRKSTTRREQHREHERHA